MTIAVRTDTLLAPTVTHQALFDAIKAAFVNSGFVAPFDDFVSGTDKIVVYAIVLDNTKTYGTTYLRIRVTVGLVIAQQIYATWNATTHVGTGNSVEVSYTALVTNSQVNFVALNGINEYKLVSLTQAATAIALGFLSPANKPLWWDLNAWNYAFMFTSNNFSIIRSTTFNPYANTENDSYVANIRFGTANVQTNRRDLLAGIVYFTQSNQGIMGRTSDDLVIVSASGTTRYDTIQIPADTKEYLLLAPISGGLAVRYI